MKVSLNVNGKIVGKNKAVVSVFDHGFLYGDSVYETLITYEGKPFLLDLHLERLYQSAKAIHIKPSWTKERYKKEIQKTLKTLVTNNKKKCLIRISLTRGVGPIGLDPALCKKPTNIIYAQEFRDYPPSFFKKGVQISLVATQRNSRFALNPAIKSCNFLNNILAYIEAKKHNSVEGVMLNFKGEITEGTTSNIFIVKNGVLKTPHLQSGILAGLTRHMIFKICKSEKIKVQETYLRPKDVLSADECFISSTTREIMPVTSCNGKKINKGRVGLITNKLINSFHSHVQKILDLNSMPH